MSLLRVSGLSKSFGGLKAVDDVSFDLEAGQLLALLGPNGAGKSTCFNMVNGQLRPSRARSVSTTTNSSACVRAISGGSAWAAPSRLPRPSTR
jgi:ABC-type branched-subunit amino acid transport system ATPase component